MSCNSVCEEKILADNSIPHAISIMTGDLYTTSKIDWEGRLNYSPESFSGAGELFNREKKGRRVERMGASRTAGEVVEKLSQWSTGKERATSSGSRGAS
jgi:hypothetical protein